MAHTISRGMYYFVKRVPKRYASVDPRSRIQLSLKTESADVAQKKSLIIEERLVAYWEALLAEDHEGAKVHYEAAVNFAEVQGYTYLSLEEVVAEPLGGLLNRIEVIPEGEQSKTVSVVADGLLGGADKPILKVSRLYEEYLELTPDLLLGKSDDQIRKWKNPRQKAINNLITVVGDKNVHELSRDDGLKLREWWMDRVVDEGKKPSTANKDFTHLSKIFSTWRDLKREQLANPFLQLRLAQNDLQDHRPSFSRDWIKTVLLAPDAFGATNEEAVLVFKILINTGLRPSELLGAKLEHFVVEHEVPHIRVEEYSDGAIKRKLKTKWSEREVPLVGVSLDAAKRIVAMGGVQAYYLKADRWGALINKVMVERKLKETERHTPYSLRHSFEESMLEAGVDHRLRVELMGHAYNRPKYGEGGSLELKREAISRFAFV
ncbi:Tyrosine recombinase XerC [Pseudovibrio sp. Ad46]|uniref:tyrosine-type recombinase/integrase n=1 Tax=unclassified Pseudovibrio TaxID=2627060 RepID=UPI0007B285AE|nr:MULTISPECIES: tyrosine-type recombinase/integrase [unclassified Pseudovibrio]KZK79727.1 Tyrosine recombinase XerC [Pseudovibrio sp. Ad46]KZK97246.1 Tyrosine recombinase XerC [Pseudovibrio sp. Ad5]